MHTPITQLDPNSPINREIINYLLQSADRAPSAEGHRLGDGDGLSAMAKRHLYYHPGLLAPEITHIASQVAREHRRHELPEHILAEHGRVNPITINRTGDTALRDGIKRIFDAVIPNHEEPAARQIKYTAANLLMYAITKNRYGAYSNAEVTEAIVQLVTAEHPENTPWPNYLYRAFTAGPYDATAISSGLGTLALGVVSAVLSFLNEGLLSDLPLAIMVPMTIVLCSAGLSILWQSYRSRPTFLPGYGQHLPKLLYDLRGTLTEGTLPWLTAEYLPLPTPLAAPPAYPQGMPAPLPVPGQSALQSGLNEIIALHMSPPIEEAVILPRHASLDAFPIARWRKEWRTALRLLPALPGEGRSWSVLTTDEQSLVLKRLRAQHDTTRLSRNIRTIMSGRHGTEPQRQAAAGLLIIATREKLLNDEALKDSLIALLNNETPAAEKIADLSELDALLLPVTLLLVKAPVLLIVGILSLTLYGLFQSDLTELPMALDSLPALLGVISLGFTIGLSAKHRRGPHRDLITTRDTLMRSIGMDPEAHQLNTLETLHRTTYLQLPWHTRDSSSTQVNPMAAHTSPEEA